jgi:ERI1 exoribonuclease 3
MVEQLLSTVLRRIRLIARGPASLARRWNSTTSAWSICRRLRNSHLMAVANETQPAQRFDYFLILDFEATCDKDVQLSPQEIIEFPVLKINSRTFETKATFHHYVQPDVHKQLSVFCTELTGIIQEQIDDQPNLQQTLQMFDQWMDEQGLLSPDSRSIFVTCGDWDLQTMLQSQCRYLNIQTPAYFRRWINIKKPFCDVTGTYPKGMMQMLKMLQLSHVGKHHSGIDDCRNIGSILRVLGDRYYVFQATKELRN